MRPTRCLVVAKAPVPGEAKTRLGARIGMQAAAEAAAAALLDTLHTATAAYGADACLLALTGDVSRAARAEEIRESLVGWTVFSQEGDDFAARLAHAHLETARRAAGPVVQIGMDTPQVTPDLLQAVAAGLETHDAVLGPAADGGWWALGLRDPAQGAALAGVPASTATTGADTLAALIAAGLTVLTVDSLRDVDTVEDAAAVAAAAPSTRFARAWSALGSAVAT